MARNLYYYAPINTIVTLVIFFLFRMYNSLWRYASIDEVVNILYACTLAEAIQFFGIKMANLTMSTTYFGIDFMLMITLVTASRFCYRFLRLYSSKAHAENKRKIMIIGAGEAANAIIKEITISSYLDGVVVCAIDDNKDKINSYIQGVKIVGDRSSIVHCVREYQVTDIIIAMPSVGRRDIKEILDICKDTGCQMKILPGMYQLINEEVSVSRLRRVEIEDLLGREPIQLNVGNIMTYISDKVVLVTGGGGSIGSELCRQIVKYAPKQLVIFDIYENNAYDIQQELKHDYPNVDVRVIIGSVRNTERVNKLFETYRPDIVYHAAAHKHVPLMEDSPNEAIKNNVFGTYKTAIAASKYGAKRFVLISTDKAVNPTNVMGASKRMCEMIIQAFNRNSDTEFVAVRFGNVLGSNGSVIPLFRKQIEAGGPVTVTHPDIIRYFMTIPEAVSLVLEAGALARGGEIFILDMGEPVKILDLAKNLIRLSGYTIGRDIQIQFTGLRPGEKLFEEMLMDEEGLKETNNKMIHIGKPIEFNEELFFEKLDDLYKSVYSECDNVRELIKEMVPTYQYNTGKSELKETNKLKQIEDVDIEDHVSHLPIKDEIK
ncbi:UDP-N-acetylglucosamine 4,6-dehydratase [Lachnospiraceae bacterium KM106-2]|nr:UDP-N-acetylglucosamine 4,6-dehydratase [Lachnospiraceae bacterium KM106-2]